MAAVKYATVSLLCLLTLAISLPMDDSRFLDNEDDSTVSKDNSEVAIARDSDLLNNEENQYFVGRKRSRNANLDDDLLEDEENISEETRIRPRHKRNSHGCPWDNHRCRHHCEHHHRKNGYCGGFLNQHCECHHHHHHGGGHHGGGYDGGYRPY